MTIDYYIGIDAGGTDWEAVLCTSDYQIHARNHFEGMNLRATKNPNRPAFKLRDIIEEMTIQAGVLPYHIALTVLAGAGAGDEKLRGAIGTSCQSIIPNNQVQLVSDAEAALEGAFADAPGVIVIAGTGSIALGMDSEGKVARAGGYGHLLGDEGSGFWIGRETVRACLEAHNRGEEIPLASKILELWKLESISEMVTMIYSSDKPPAKLAEIAPLVIDAAEAGEEVALKILNAAGAEIGKLVQSVAEKLDFGNEIKVCLCGGLSKRKDILEPLIKEVLDPAKFIFVTPKHDPALGAVILGRRLTGK